VIAALFALSIAVDTGPMGCRAGGRTGAASIEVVDEDADVRGTLSFVDPVGSAALDFPMTLAKGTHKRWVIPLPPVTHLSVRWRGDAGPVPAIQERPRADCAGPLVASLAREGIPAAVRWPSSRGGASFEIGELAPADLDASWVTLESADAVLAEARAVSELSDARFGTLLRWVDAGGLLVVVPGADPAPLAASKRLGEVDFSSMHELAEGRGTIVTSPAPPDAAPAPIADALLGEAFQSHRDRELRNLMRASVGNALETAGGPAGIPPIPPLVIATMLGAFAVLHDFLRRRWVGGTARDLRRYVPVTAGGIAGLSVIALAGGALGGASAQPLLIVPSGGSSGVSLRLLDVAAGGSTTLDPGFWPRLSSPGRIVALDGGARFSVQAGALPTSGIAIASASIEGTVTVEPGRIVNGLARPLSAGWEIEGAVRPIPSIAAGAFADPGDPVAPPQWDVFGRTAAALAHEGRHGYLVPMGGSWLFVETGAP
jgi:hypothetical protein